MIESDRLITARSNIDEERQDRAIRPKKLADYVGQKNCAPKWRFLFKRQQGAKKHWIMCLFLGHQA